jgi:1-acyl-sn-glycerol-3-phosphate acyltransferase
MTAFHPIERAVERAALEVCSFVNRNPAAKALQSAFQRRVSNRWVHAVIARRLVVHGLEHAVDLAPDRGVLLVANHRSFFDQYVLMSVLYAEAAWPRRSYFPVRSTYFYESWTGLVLNGAIGGFAMWPPIFRDPARSEWNKVALEQICEVVRVAGVVVGMHPEGTRGKGPNPYELLPAQPGVGQIIMRARPIVLPAWVNGIGNDFAAEIAAGVTGDPKIRCVFGAPLDFGALLETNARPAQYKRVADFVLEEIAKLGAIERGLS